jgi:ATP-dependent RNA helicase DDX27
VKTVINFSMPMNFKGYIHRVGRTARAQNLGRAISLVGESERWLVKEIIKSSKEPVKCRVIPNETIEFYREKCGALRNEIVETLKEEDNQKEIEKMENDVRK